MFFSKKKLWKRGRPPPYGKFHKKNVFFIETFPKSNMSNIEEDEKEITNLQILITFIYMRRCFDKIHLPFSTLTN